MANGSVFFLFKVGNHQPLESGLDQKPGCIRLWIWLFCSFGCNSFQRLTFALQALKLGKSTKTTETEVCWSFEQSEIDTLRSKMTPWPGRKGKKGVILYKSAIFGGDQTILGGGNSNIYIYI